MNEIEVVKEMMRTKKASGAVLAKKMGFNTPSAVTNRLQGKTITVEVLVKLLDALDCELVIRHKMGDKESFIVDNENRNEVKSYNTSKKRGDA